MEVRSGHVPATAVQGRPQQERSLDGSDQQHNVAVFHAQVSNATRYCGEWSSLLAGLRRRGDRCRLHGLERRLNLPRLLVSLGRLLGQAALDDSPEAGRYPIG